MLACHDTKVAPTSTSLGRASSPAVQVSPARRCAACARRVFDEELGKLVKLEPAPSERMERAAKQAIWNASSSADPLAICLPPTPSGFARVRPSPPPAEECHGLALSHSIAPHPESRIAKPHLSPQPCRLGFRLGSASPLSSAAVPAAFASGASSPPCLPVPLTHPPLGFSVAARARRRSRARILEEIHGQSSYHLSSRPAHPAPALLAATINRWSRVPDAYSALRPAPREQSYDLAHHFPCRSHCRVCRVAGRAFTSPASSSRRGRRSEEELEAVTRSNVPRTVAHIAPYSKFSSRTNRYSASIATASIPLSGPTPLLGTPSLSWCTHRACLHLHFHLPQPPHILRVICGLCVEEEATQSLRRHAQQQRAQGEIALGSSAQSITSLPPPVPVRSSSSRTWQAHRWQDGPRFDEQAATDVDGGH
ncbi:hypothetical protein DFH08DRAFT_971788 [Mycena albidolilacea]|uniref:Uncharacterized protein n=1 Tax=Mycena albidolilacea TaxID=1033008 RepID=A0AAD6ZCI1_9AGAR|nr:hypothetical protein DFH08DRAFT_971788 [Mycena albidolilacea]